MKDDFFLLQTGFCLVWLKDWNNVFRLLFYPFEDNKQSAFSIPKYRYHFLLMEPTLSSLALNNRLLSIVFIAVWILVCNGESKSHP